MKVGFVGIVGLANAGKSTLLNALVGEKLSIVTDKPQTTRNRITGILTYENTQIVFVDSPGFVKDKIGINNFLESEYNNIIKTSDILLVLLPLDLNNPNILFKLIDKYISRPNVIFVITKTDIKPRRRFILENKMKDAIFCSVSAKCKPQQAKAEILEKIEPLLPKADSFLFDPEQLSTISSKELAAEKIREQCFNLLLEEIPYGLAVQVRSYDDNNKELKIYADIIIEKENHKKIVIGRDGRTIQEIRTRAEITLKRFFSKKTTLSLHVSVKKKWRQNSLILKNLGFNNASKDRYNRKA